MASFTCPPPIWGGMLEFPIYKYSDISVVRGPRPVPRTTTIGGRGVRDLSFFWILPVLQKYKKYSQINPFHFWGIPIYLYIPKVKSLFSVVFFVSFVRYRRLRIRHFTGGRGGVKMQYTGLAKWLLQKILENVFYLKYQFWTLYRGVDRCGMEFY